MKRPRILTIAGSDSGGGAAIQADLKSIAAHCCYGMSAITAMTAQNTRGVHAVLDASPAFIESQLDAVLEDIGCDAAKTGMLSREESIRAVAAGLSRHQVPNLVVDPVMVSKSGHRLLAGDAIDALVTALVPLARLITPNLHEVEELTGRLPGNVEEMEEAARELAEFGAGAVLVKGGHLPGEQAVDVLWDGTKMQRLESERVDCPHTHGTGCTLSAAIACGLARGEDIGVAVKSAKVYLVKAMKAAYPVGGGIGPVNHLWEFESGAATTSE